MPPTDNTQSENSSSSNDVLLRNGFEYLKRSKLSRLAFISTAVSIWIFIDYLSFIGLRGDIQNALGMVSVFGILFGLTFFFLFSIVLSFIGPYLLGIWISNSQSCSKKTQTLLRLEISYILFWPFFWLFWISFIKNFDILFWGWLCLGSLVIGAFFYLFPKGLKWYWLSLPFLGSALLLACQIFLVPSMPSSWDVGIWLLYCLLWAVFAIYTFMKNKHPQQRRLLVVFRKVFPQYSFALIVGEVFLPLLLVFIFIYLFPLIIHMSIVNTWTRESEYQYILFVAFTAAFLVNLLFSSLFLQQRLTEQGEARQ